MMKSAVAYMRMSTDKQEHSIESQHRLIEDYAKRNDFLIQDVYADAGISGRIAEKRPAFMKMIEDSEKGLFDYVLIHDSSRFARNLEQSLVYKSILKRNNVELVSVTEPTLDADTSLITDALFGAMNEMYSRKLSKNVKRGMEQKALRGEYCSHAPFGYDYSKSKKMLLPNDKESPIVRYIFSEFINGKSAYWIAQEMREKNIRTKRNVFLSVRRINYMVCNPVYKGYMQWGKGENHIIQKSNHEPLVDKKNFDELQKMIHEKELKSSYQTYRNTEPRHWLSGILRCSACNSTYTYVKEREGKKDRFRCNGQSHGICSSSSSFMVWVLEDAVLNILKEITTNDNQFYHIRIRHTAQPVVNYDRNIKNLKQSLRRAKEAYLSGLDTLTEYGENKKIITKELEHLEVLKKKQHIKNFDMEHFRVKLLDVISILESDADFMLKKSSLHSIVERIVIEKGTKHMQLYFYD